MSKGLDNLHARVKVLDQLLEAREIGLSSWWMLLETAMKEVGEYDPRGPRIAITEWIDWILEYGDHKDNCKLKSPDIMFETHPGLCDCGWREARIKIYEIAKDVSPTEEDVGK